MLQLNQDHPGPFRAVPQEFQPPASEISSNLTAPTVQCEFVLMRVAQGESHFLFIYPQWEALVEWRGTVVVPAQAHAHTHAHACMQSVVTLKWEICSTGHEQEKANKLSLEPPMICTWLIQTGSWNCCKRGMILAQALLLSSSWVSENWLNLILIYPDNESKKRHFNETKLK